MIEIPFPTGKSYLKYKQAGKKKLQLRIVGKKYFFSQGENAYTVNFYFYSWGQFNKEIQVYFTSRTLVFTNSHQFESTKIIYKFPLEASNLYLQWYSVGFDQL